MMIRWTARLLVNLLCLLGWVALYPLRRWRRRELAGGPPIRRILVFNDAGGIGNLVLLTALLSNARRLFPAARIAVAMPSNPAAAALLSPELADDLLFFDPRDRRRRSLLRFAYRKLRPRRFDLGLATFFTPTLLTSCVLLAARCRYRLAYAPSRGRGFLNTVSLMDRGGHELDRHLRLLDFAGRHLQRRTAVAPDADGTRFAQAFLAPRAMTARRPLLGVHPGSDWRNTAKRWPLERFVTVLRHAVRKEDLDVLLFLGPDDMDLLPRITTELGDLVRLVGDESLANVAALIAECDFFLANDTGLMHLAAAFGVPVIALFGPTAAARSAPAGPATLLTAAGVPCRPCYAGPPLTCRYGQRYCLEEISVADVIRALQQLIGCAGRSAPPAMAAQRSAMLASTGAPEE